MTNATDILSRLAKAALAVGLMTISLIVAGPASAEAIYRGLLIDGQGALDMRTARFSFAGGGLSFNKDLNTIAASPSNFRCALRMDTTVAIPNVGNSSPLRNFSSFQGTYDAAPPNPPPGHVSVTVAPPHIFATPAATFANELKSEAMDRPDTFAETYIVGVTGADSSEECGDRPKSFN